MLQVVLLDWQHKLFGLVTFAFFSVRCRWSLFHLTCKMVPLPWLFHLHLICNHDGKVHKSLAGVIWSDRFHILEKQRQQSHLKVFVANAWLYSSALLAFISSDLLFDSDWSSVLAIYFPHISSKRGQVSVLSANACDMTLGREQVQTKWKTFGDGWTWHPCLKGDYPSTLVIPPAL